MISRIPRLSAGVVVVRQSAEGWRFLLLRAFSHWDFPKGMVEAGEEPLTAAIREVREESAITDLEFAWGEVCTETGPYSHGKTARYHVARTGTIDVLSQEPPVDGNPLLAPDIPNLIITPHIAWAAREARQRCIDEMAANVTDFTRGGRRGRVV